MKSRYLLLLILFGIHGMIFPQTPITDDNFNQAIEICLSTNPVDGLCYDSEYGAMPDWDVSAVTDMSDAFYEMFDFNADITGWDVSNVTNMSQMFSLSDFNQNIGDWNVENVTDMSKMFSVAMEFNGDIANWDVGNVTDMTSMFTDAKSFNQPIGNWDVSSVTKMTYMFTGATSFNQNIGNWDVNNVTSMYWMFHGATSFNQEIDNWEVGNVTDMGFMFCYSVFNQNLSSWDVSSVFNMEQMFRDSEFNQDIGNWDVRNVYYMVKMFDGATYFNQDLSGWCVEHFSTCPASFADDCPLSLDYYPKWGETCPNDINENTENTTVVYPNPVRNIIEIKLAPKSIETISIYNEVGQIVFSSDAYNGAIDVSTIVSGQYIIEIKTSDRVYKEKILKQ